MGTATAAPVVIREGYRGRNSFKKPPERGFHCAQIRTGLAVITCLLTVFGMTSRAVADVYRAPNFTWIATVTPNCSVWVIFWGDLPEPLPTTVCAR